MSLKSNYSDRTFRIQMSDFLQIFKSKIYNYNPNDIYSNHLLPYLDYQLLYKGLISYRVKPKAKIFPYTYCISFDIDFKNLEVLNFHSTIKTTQFDIDFNTLILNFLKDCGLNVKFRY